MSESRLLSTTVYRGYVLELMALEDGRTLVRVLRDGQVLTGYLDTAKRPAVDAACNWVERQTERAG